MAASRCLCGVNFRKGWAGWTRSSSCRDSLLSSFRIRKNSNVQRSWIHVQTSSLFSFGRISHMLSAGTCVRRITSYVSTFGSLMSGHVAEENNGTAIDSYDVYSADDIDSEIFPEDHAQTDTILEKHKSKRGRKRSVQSPHRPLLNKMIYREYLTIDQIKKILEDQYCIDLCCIKVDAKRLGAPYVDNFVVVSGRSTRHLKAMAYALVHEFKKAVISQGGDVTAVVEGDDCHDWMAVDIGHTVVHFMLPETREHYELEELWSRGPEHDRQYQKMLEDEKRLNQPLVVDDEFPDDGFYEVADDISAERYDDKPDTVTLPNIGEK